MTSPASAMLVAGSLVFFVGAAIGVPRVFTERDPRERLRMLTERRTAWRLAQPLYALGPLVAAIGVALLPVQTSGAGVPLLLRGAGAALVLGALAWCWSVWLRATRVEEFALRTLPGWPFTSYVLLTIAGLAVLGAGLLGGPLGWVGWTVLVADALFLAAYLRLRDIPPFVFYLVLLAVGLATAGTD